MKTPTKLRDEYDQCAEKAEHFEHLGWYGEPCKRAPSKEYKENYDKINWQRRKQNGR